MHKVHYLNVKIETLEKNKRAKPYQITTQKGHKPDKMKESAMDYDNRKLNKMQSKTKYLYYGST